MLLVLVPPLCEAPGTASFLPLLPAHGGQGWAVGSAGAGGGVGVAGRRVIPCALQVSSLRSRGPTPVSKVASPAVLGLSLEMDIVTPHNNTHYPGLRSWILVFHAILVFISVFIILRFMRF